MTSQNDLQCIRRIKAGDVRAFSEIVSRYQSKIFNIVYRIVENREDAEDLTQEIFVRIYKSIGKFREESELSTWIYRIAYNTTLSEFRKKRLVFTSIDDVQPLSEDSTDVVFEDREGEKQIELLEQALSKLSPEEVFLITLFYMEEKAISEIADVSDLTVSNVKVKLHRIRRKLAAGMEELRIKNTESAEPIRN